MQHAGDILRQPCFYFSCDEVSYRFVWGWINPFDSPKDGISRCRNLS